MSRPDAGLLPWLVAAYGGATVGELAIWLATLVETQDRAGNTAAGLVALVLLAPGALAAPLAGRTFDGARPIRSLALVHAVQAAAALLSALAILGDAPLGAVIAPAALSIGAMAFVRTGYTAVGPGIVRDAREFARSSLAGSTCDSASVLVGPILATVLLSWHGTAAVFEACAALALIGTVCVARLVRFDRVTPLHGGSGRPSLVRAARGLRTRPHAPALLVAFSVQYVLVGAMTLVFVVLAADEFDMGPSGAAVLNVLFGVGAATSGLGSIFFAGRGRLAPAVVLALAAMAVAAMALGGATELGVAAVALPLMGFGRSLLDAAARMLLLRSAPAEHLASLFALLEMVAGIGLALGTAVGQLAIAVAGAPAALVTVGLVVGSVLAATLVSVRRADQTAEVPLAAIALLRQSPVFAALPVAELEVVARSATERSIEPGGVLIREGEPGHSYFVVSSGELGVSVGGRPVRRLRRGDGVGEVALLTDAPRSATVVATTRAQLLEIDRSQFLTAVTGDATAFGVAWNRLGQLEYA